MKFDAKLFLKWLEARDPRLSQVTYTVIGQCVLSVQDKKKNVLGLTVFEPRDLSPAIFERLNKRRALPQFAGCDFVLTLPHFLKNRAEVLLHTPENQGINVEYSPFVEIKQSGNSFYLRKTIRVINVDDSPVVLKFLKHSLEEMGFVDVVMQVSDSTTAVDTIRKFKPDLVTMDIQMPNRTGVEVVKDLLAKEYFPVLMVSSLSMEESSQVFEALSAGAFEYLQKPKFEEKDAFREELKEKILMAVASDASNTAPVKVQPMKSNHEFSPEHIWCLGSSTGGTQALVRVFTSLPHKIPATLIVQHMPPVYSRAFAESLNNLCPFTVKEAADGDLVLPNHVYVAPGGLQMGIEKRLGKLTITIKDAPPVNRFKPSVDYLFHEVAKLVGFKIVAGVLTGMGRDGAEGLLTLKKAGVHTFVQDEKTSAVFGMPRAAYELGAADRVVPLDGIAQVLLEQSSNFKKAG